MYIGLLYVVVVVVVVVVVDVQTNRYLSDGVYNTLLELYLGELGSCKKEERGAKEKRALELLKRPEVRGVWEVWS